MNLTHAFVNIKSWRKQHIDHKGPGGYMVIFFFELLQQHRQQAAYFDSLTKSTTPDFQVLGSSGTSRPISSIISSSMSFCMSQACSAQTVRRPCPCMCVAACACNGLWLHLVLCISRNRSTTNIAWWVVHRFMLVSRLSASVTSQKFVIRHENVGVCVHLVHVHAHKAMYPTWENA